VITALFVRRFIVIVNHPYLNLVQFALEVSEFTMFRIPSGMPGQLRNKVVGYGANSPVIAKRPFLAGSFKAHGLLFLSSILSHYLASQWPPGRHPWNLPSCATELDSFNGS
jgi:hypothetical protein